MFGLCSCMIKLCQPSPAKLDCFCCILTLHYFTWLIIVLFVIMEKCSLWCCSQGMWRGVCKSKWRCSTFQLFEMFAFKKKRKKKGCGIFVSPLLFLSLFFLKNTFKGGGEWWWWRRHNVTTRELWIQCSSGFANVSFVSFVSIAAIFCDKLLEHYFTCDFRLWYFCFSSLHAIAAYSFVQTPWDG